MNEPIDHHYLPVFYLSRWAGNDGRVCRFSRPRGNEIKAKRVVPKGTGYEPGLYATRGLPVERAQAMEKDFMQKLDTAAADALSLLEAGAPDKAWNSRLRSAWSRFLLAQMLRAPEDIAQLRSSVKEDWSKVIPKMEEVYARERKDSDPATASEYLAQLAESEADKSTFTVARQLMNHPKIGQTLNNMHWLVMEISSDGMPLLTSDRPIWMTATLTEEDALLVMPIGPIKLFTAATGVATHGKLMRQLQTDLIKAVNQFIVQHAVKYVYGATDITLPFVQEHMSTKRHSSLLERLAAKRGHAIVGSSA